MLLLDDCDNRLDLLSLSDDYFEDVEGANEGQAEADKVGEDDAFEVERALLNGYIFILALRGR